MDGFKFSKFSVLRYVPDENREEFINIGLAFHCPEESFIDIKITNNFSRVSIFDDEVDIAFLKVILEGIKDDLSQTTLSGPSFSEINNEKYLDNYTKFFVNQIQFSPVRTIRSIDLQDDFEKLFMTYVYFDVHKKKRITEVEVKTIMNRVLRSNDVFSKLDRNISVDIGPEVIQLDYMYKTRDRVKMIKTFSFDYTTRKSNQATQTAKEWAYNFVKLKTKNTKLYDEHVDFITLVYIDKENKNIMTALEILKEETKTIQAKGFDAVRKFASEISNEVEAELEN